MIRADAERKLKGCSKNSRFTEIYSLSWHSSSKLGSAHLTIS